MSGTLVHDALVYGSDDHFVDELAPFALDGIAAGDAVYVVSRADNCALLEDALGSQAENVQYIDAAEWYRSPAQTIGAYDRVIRSSRAQGTPRLRVIGEVEFGTTATEHAEWARYESVLNHVFAAHPAWIVCPYDARRLPESVVADALRTHPHTFTGGSRRPSERFVDPAGFVRSLPIALPGELIEAIELNGSTRPARALVRRTASQVDMTPERVEEMCLAVSELATNAIMHAQPPATVRAYADGSVLVYEVSDAGPGLADPFAGFLPPNPSQRGGAGLWISRQLADRLEIDSTDHGTTVRLLVGRG